MSAVEYHHGQRTKYTLQNCADALGKRATLVLTGTVIEARNSEAGPHVVFQLDERYGFQQDRFVMDLDLLDLA